MRLRILALLAVSMVIAGCGSGKPSHVTDSSQQDNPIPIPTFAAGTTMARIQATGKLNVGTSYSQGAFSAQDSSGTLTGFDIELTDYIAQAIFGGTRAAAAQKIDYVQAEANNREAFLRNGTVDIAVGAYQITSARQALVDFAGPEYAAHAEAIVPATNTQVQAISDLNGDSVCSSSNPELNSALNSAAPQANLVPKSTFNQCIDAINAKKVDAVVGYDWILAPIVQANPSLRIVNSSFLTVDYGIGLPQDDEEFRQFLNTTLQSIESTKQWDVIFSHTLGATGLPPASPPSIDNSSPTTTTSSTSSSTLVSGDSGSTTTSLSMPPSGTSTSVTVSPSK